MLDSNRSRRIRIFLSVVVLFTARTAVSPRNCEIQNGSDSGGLVVVEKHWQKVEKRNLDDSPFRANDEHDLLVQAQKENIRQNEIRVKKGALPEPNPEVSGSPKSQPQRSSTVYLYSAMLLNNGPMRIRSVVWEYQFLEKDTLTEVGNHRFTSRVDVPPQEHVRLFGRSTLPPDTIVSSKNAGKRLGDQVVEQVIIFRIEYADGSAWQRPAN